MPSSLSRLSRTVLFNALRFTFRLAPLPQSIRDRLRQRFLDKYADMVPPGPRGQLDSTRPIRRPYVRADERAIGYVPYLQAKLPDPMPATLVAFYLPQFHPIPENDEWWGKGFTEWRNVTRALPQFEGHAQPRLPGDLGFYDLRDPSVMREQARLAREYGIGAFCFYFYWFGGKTLLETPLLNWLADPSIDLPFCLCWANEKWSRRWDGRGGDILIDQTHSAEDDLAFIEHVSDYIRDPRWLRVDGKPLLLVYRPGLLPNPSATAFRWRTWCRNNGIGEVHLAYVQGFDRPDPVDIGFDAAVEFPPNMVKASSIASTQTLVNPGYSGEILDWRDLAKNSQASQTPNYTLYPTVNPGWDNEPRRPGTGRTFRHSSPRRYRDWLTATARLQQDKAALPARLIFINAWNEWAEGAILEPDANLGFGYLNATRQALISLSNETIQGPTAACALIHAWHIDVLDELLVDIQNSGVVWRIVITTSHDRVDAVRSQLSRRGMNAEIMPYNNRGRDVLPFLHAANFLLDQGVEVVLKLHTKRSSHRGNGEQWRRELVDRLLRPSRATKIIAAFSQRPELGIVGPEGHVLAIKDYLGGNGDNLRSLAVRCGIADPITDGKFVSGSMFWVRLSSLRPLLDTMIFDSDFEEETEQTDATFAHAIERFFSACGRSAGYETLTAATACDEPEIGNGHYPYAAPG